MVDHAIVERKAQAVAHHLTRLRARRDVRAADLERDEDLWNVVLMDLLQAIQPCIDLAVHLVVDEGLGVVAGPRLDERASCASAGVSGPGPDQHRRLSAQIYKQFPCAHTTRAS